MLRLLARLVLIFLATTACALFLLSLLFPLPDLKPLSVVVNDRRGTSCRLLSTNNQLQGTQKTDGNEVVKFSDFKKLRGE